MSALSGRELIKRIKPELPSLGILSSSIAMETNGAVTLTVNYILTDELLSKMALTEEEVNNGRGSQKSS